VCTALAGDRRPVTPWFRVAGAGALALACLAPTAPAQTGTLVGRITNAVTGTPVTAAQVAVTGTRLAMLVNGDGRFRFTDVPAGAGTVVARAVGYMPLTTAFALEPNDTAVVSLAMTLVDVELDAVVVTGSLGDARRRAVGHAVAVVDASAIAGRSAVTNIAEVLQAKVPGLAVAPTSGTVGTASVYRARGAGSLGAGNTPTIYVDGVKVSSRSQGSYDVFGQTTTALDAINPADIESIEVIKGPSSATLYGAEAAAGVIQIFTKKGRAGRTRWDARVEMGQSDWDKRLRPVNHAIATAGRLDSLDAWPGFEGKALGDVIAFRPMTDGRALRTAGLLKLVVAASGGADRYTFFVSAARANEDGVYFNSFANLASVRGNITLVPANTLTFTTNVALSRSHVRLPINDNAGPMGLISSSYLAVPGRHYDAPGGRDYSSITPELANAYDNQTWADRYTIGVSADHAPVSWFRHTFRAGLDANVGRAELYFPPDPRTPFFARASLEFDNSLGLIAHGRPLNHDVTLNYDGTIVHRWSDKVVANTSFGMQYLANVFRRTDAIGVDFGSADMRSIASAAITRSAEASSEQKSVGFFAQQQVSLDERLFVTLATRVDNSSVFGPRLSRVFYPKASISYVISEEPYFDVPGISSLRLRAAWGQAGNVPGPFDASRSYVASVVTYATRTTSALRYGSPGNPDLRPERGTEIDAGFESAFLRGRVKLDASYYHKTTRDALIPVPVPASTGFTGDQLINLGKVSNTGVELLLSGTPVQTKRLAVDATISLATNRNRLVSFGYDRGPMPFGFSAASQRHQEGFPLGALWAQQPRYNPDGSLLKVAGLPIPDTASVYVGPSVPTREMSFSAGVLFFGALRISGLADYKSGHFQFDVTDWRRDRAGVSWETVNPAADPDEVLVRRSASLTLLHIQSADFVKLRDVSIGYDVPQRVLQRVARRATLTVAGHNLKIWTRYRGADPEVNSSGPFRFNREDLWTVPQTRRYSAAVALTF
jgi:TonB-dependent SusC/RagA subfamily outer membrane receptor